jgi:hypothetical protein
MVATSQLVAGIAAGVYLAPAAGTHTIAASYMGDANFMAGVSPGVSVAVQAMPDFSISMTGTASQTVAAGSIASYGLSVSPQGGAFSGAGGRDCHVDAECADDGGDGAVVRRCGLLRVSTAACGVLAEAFTGSGAVMCCVASDCRMWGARKSIAVGCCK